MAENSPMNKSELELPRQAQVRTVLRRSGLSLLAIGLLLTIVGVASFFMAFGGSDFPRFFWCAFVGIPLIFLGSAMSMFGFAGSMQRYVVGEVAPVAKDALNYMGTNTQPGVRAVASAITSGVLDAQAQHRAPEDKESET
jgi:hypothetical protein